jgi:hypothetical protein
MTVATSEWGLTEVSASKETRLRIKKYLFLLLLDIAVASWVDWKCARAWGKAKEPDFL